MGNLEPNATLIYERADGVIYARKIGQDPTTRLPVGWDLDTQKKLEKFRHDTEWQSIFEEAEHNAALQDALSRVKVIYELSKQDDTIPHHPV